MSITDGERTNWDGVATGRGRAATIALWTGQILLALAFLGAGTSKLLGDDRMVEMFDQIGLGQWFRYLTATLELCGAVLLLVPRLAFFGATLIAVIMAGTVASHLLGIGGSPVPALVLLAVASLVAWGRRGRLTRRFQGPTSRSE